MISFLCKDIAAFSSAYLACNRANRIAVVAAHARKECTFLFRSHLEGDVVLEDEEDEGDKEGDNTKKTKKKKKRKKPKKGGGEETREDLLERALCSFLPDRYTRRFLRPPRAGSIDFRSSCFCHGNRISKGFVCSVCLSVFCEKEGSCQTCGAAFV
ncbi:unnamed protein product [Bathycoccus prasinos]